MAKDASFAAELFKNYAEKLQQELELLKNFEEVNFNKWEIKWKEALEISNDKKRIKPWKNIPVYKDLLKNKDSPSIYYFTVESKDAKLIFDNFQKNKEESSSIRIEKGLKEEGYFNISHVPNKFNLSNCIYVGSRKNNLHSRLIQHLGFSTKGRTGALYLHRHLKSFKPLPKIFFHYLILDEKYTNLTEHIECVIQDSLNPFIGKRAIKKSAI